MTHPPDQHDKPHTVGRITAIHPTAKNPTRATIRVDGRVVATLSLKRIERLDLAVDQPWTDDLAHHVSQAAAQDKAYRQAMNKLNHRPMSRHRLDRKLADLGYDAPTREAVLDQLESTGALNDHQLAQIIVRDQLARKPAGRKLLLAKLYQRGIDRNVAEPVINEALADHPTDERALELAQRRLRTLRRLEPAVRRRRLWGLLARRGFEPDTINHVMEQLADDIQDDLPA